MSHPDREQLSELLSAYLDDELSDPERTMVEKIVAQDNDARRLLAELQETINAVASLPRQGAPGSISRDLIQQMERAHLLDDTESYNSTFRTRRPWRTAITSIAAMLGIVTIASIWFVNWGTPERLGDVVATRGKLERENVNGKKARSISSDITAQQHPHASLLASATLAQKLEAGISATELANHPFENESVQLVLSLDDPTRVQALAMALESRLTKKLSISSFEERVTGARSSSQENGFYRVGQYGVNHTERDQQQILIRLPAHQIDLLVDAVADAASSRDRVSLRVNSIRFAGIDKTRSILRQLAKLPEQTIAQDASKSKPSWSDKTSQTSPTNAAKSSDDDAGMFEDLFEVLGIDPEVFAIANASPSPAKKTPSSHTGLAQAQTQREQPEDSRDVASFQRTETRDDDSSLVTRRSRALRKTKARRDSGKSQPPAVEAMAQIPPRFITLVIQLRPAESSREKTTRIRGLNPSRPKPNKSKDPSR